MREIKFRLWLGGFWHYWGFVQALGGSGLGFAGLPSTNMEDFTLEEMQERSQQYTGLHDKNGVEIWEGDIVSVDRKDSFPTFNKAVIVYAETYGAFLLQYAKQANPKGLLSKESISSQDGKTIYDYCTGWDLEVIGNTTENPELAGGE